MDKVLLVIPAYNEGKNIERVVDHIKNDFPELDYVVVNDGSKDDTADICRRRGYNFIDLPVNLGLAGCFQTGMKYAWQKGYNYAVQFDGDGQHRPEYIQAMKEKMDEGYDIVIGSRFVTEKKSWSMRMFGSRLIGTAIWLTTGAKIKDPTSGMRLFSRKMIGEFAWNLNYGPEPDTVSFLIRQGAKIAEVQVTIDDRTAGESYLKPLTAVSYMVRMLLRSSYYIREIMLQEPMSCGILQAALSMLLQVWSFLFWSSAWQERKKAVFSPLVILRWASSCF